MVLATLVRASYLSLRKYRTRVHIGSVDYGGGRSTSECLASNQNKQLICNRSISTQDDGGHLLSLYHRMIKEANVHEDQHQIKALRVLDRLYDDINDYHRNLPKVPKAAENSTSTLWGFLKKAIQPETAQDGFQSDAAQKAPRGVYIHGGVGCGKTFVMNIFYDQVHTQDKQQVHFHKFMLNVHQEMHQIKKNGTQGDVLPQIVQRTLQRGTLLCFDEFQVTDVADALILQRLFTSLMEKGAIVVITSNRPPEDLYLGGLQRDRFLPFIDLLQNKLDVVSMWDSETDYRLVQGHAKAKGVYFVGDIRKNDFNSVWDNLTEGSKVRSESLSTQGRLVHIPQAAINRGVARFRFHDVCVKALGAADYLTIGQTFHTVFIEDIPKMTRDQLNWVRRFIIFVDSMYESHVKLIIHAEGQPEDLFSVDLEDESCDEVFAFDRTRSRLEEMRSRNYLAKRWSGKQSRESHK